MLERTSPHQWPEPNADKSETKRAPIEHRICFYVAYGMECLHKPGRFLHGQATLPFGYYSGVCRNNPALVVFDGITNMHNAYEVPVPNFESGRALETITQGDTLNRSSWSIPPSLTDLSHASPQSLPISPAPPEMAALRARATQMWVNTTVWNP